MEYILIPNKDLRTRAARLTEKILFDLYREGIEEVTVLVVMQGAYTFYLDMAAAGLKSNPRLKITPIFHQLSSYINRTSTGIVSGVELMDSAARK